MKDAVLQGIALGLFLSVSVGPVIFGIIKLSLRFGHKSGYAFAFGVSASDILLVVLGNVAAELVRTALRYEKMIAIVGGGILIVMGVVSFFFRKDPKPDGGDGDMTFRKRDLLRFGLQGFFINIFNPAPILFWLTTCTAFAFLPLAERLVLFGTTLAIILLSDVAKVLLAGRLRNWLTPHVLHIINKVSAVIFVIFGILILVRFL